MLFSIFFLSFMVRISKDMLEQGEPALRPSTGRTSQAGTQSAECCEISSQGSLFHTWHCFLVIICKCSFFTNSAAGVSWCEYFPCPARPLPLPWSAPSVAGSDFTQSLCNADLLPSISVQ